MSSWQFRLLIITATAFGGRAWGTGDVGSAALLAIEVLAAIACWEILRWSLGLMTTTHPLARSRRLFLRETTTLEVIRAQYQEQGMVDEALQMERCLDYLGEATRIVEGLMAATTAKEG